MGKRLCPPLAGLALGPACGIASGLGCRVRSSFSHQGAGQEIAPPRSSVRRLGTRASRAGGRSNRGAFCRGIVSLGNGPGVRARTSSTMPRVGFRTGAIFSRPRPSFDRRSGSALVPGDRRKPDIGEMSAAVVGCILQRGAEFNSAGGYLRGLTRKSEVGLFFGSILMAQISSRRRDNERA